ncbi:MAG: hypothetical protein QG576_721 [Bacteroidota bacterium]|nr:hypothetical protein [Bacteroidota bacterium]
MKNRFEKFIRVIILTTLFIAIMSGACNNKGGIDKGDLIPEKVFISILTDVYLADGLLSLSQINDRFSSKDSVTNYIEIIESYGYTKRSMDNTVKYYIVNKPKRFIRIYDQVLGHFSKMESLLIDEPDKTLVYEPNPFDVNYSHKLPDPEGSEKPGFDFVLTPPANYNLTFTVTVYPDDKSVNPCFTAFLCNADTTKIQRVEFLPLIKYQKNGLPYTHTISGRIEGNDTLILKGWFYDYENRPDIQGQHALIENISFSVTGKE